MTAESWQWLLSEDARITLAAIAGTVTLALVILTYIWRVTGRRQDRKAAEKKNLSESLVLLDELIHSYTPDHMLSGLSSDVAHSSQLLASKSDRRHSILRELERTARQLPSRKYENVAQDLLAIVNSLDWNEWRAVKVKNKLARLINPTLANDAKDEHALNENDWH